MTWNCRWEHSLLRRLGFKESDMAIRSSALPSPSPTTTVAAPAASPTAAPSITSPSLLPAMPVALSAPSSALAVPALLGLLLLFLGELDDFLGDPEVFDLELISA